MPIADVNGLKVNYLRIDGKGSADPRPVVVFVHGLGTDSLASFYLTLASPVSTAGIDVLAYDLRGHGKTSQPPVGYTVGDFVDDLTGLLDCLAIDRPVHIVGNSFGGTLAFAVAAAQPQRVASVISIESEPPTAVWAKRLQETLQFVRRDLAREDTYLWLAATFGTHHARLSRQAYQRMTATTMIDEIPQGPLLALNELDRITCPVMSIIGDEGFQADDPYLLESILTNCRTVIIPDQDHSVLVEAHRDVRTLVIDWIFEQHLTGLDATIPAAGRGRATG